jgi:hypothetical protein
MYSSFCLVHFQCVLLKIKATLQRQTKYTKLLCLVITSSDSIKRKYIRILVAKYERKTSVVRSEQTWADDIKTDVTNGSGKCRLHSLVSDCELRKWTLTLRVHFLTGWLTMHQLHTVCLYPLLPIYNELLGMSCYF